MLSTTHPSGVDDGSGGDWCGGEGGGEGEGGEGEGGSEGEERYSPQVQRVLSRIHAECSSFDTSYGSASGSGDRNVSPDNDGNHSGPRPGPSPWSPSSVFERVVEYSPRLLRVTFEKKVASLAV